MTVGRLQIGLRLDTRSVERGLRDVARRGRRLRPFFASMRRPAGQDQRNHARGRQGPQHRWPPLSAATRAKAGRRKPLGKMTRASARTSRVSHSALVIRHKWQVSGVHQEGARSTGHGAEVPARPFLWFSDEFVDGAATAWLAYALDEWGRV